MDSAHHTRLHHSHSVLRHIAKLWFPSGLIPSIILPHYRSVVISVIVPTRLILSLALHGLMILGSLPYYSRQYTCLIAHRDGSTTGRLRTTASTHTLLTET